MLLSWLRAGKRGLGRLSWATTLTVVGSFLVGVLLLAAITPLVLRYFLLPNVVSHRQQLDFTFRTCDDQLSGICSYPEAIFDLEQEGLTLSPNYYYTFKLTMELFENSQNKQLGVFQAQVSPKTADGKVIASFKKQVLFKQSFLGNLYRLVRNTCLFPLYLIGYFTQSDCTVDVKFPNNFLERSSQPTAVIAVQLQNKYVQVADAYLELGAHVGLSGYLLSEFPILSYLGSFGLCFAVNMALFLVYWGNKGIRVFADSDVQADQAVFNPSGRTMSISEKTALKRVIPANKEEPSTPANNSPREASSPSTVSSPRPTSPESGFDEETPETWNRDEVPENVPFDELDIPGWGPEAEKPDEAINAVADAIANTVTRDAIESLTNVAQNGLRKRRDSVRIVPRSQLDIPELVE
uniref:Seipin n=1 Tax=Panagrellus redivivus TaxID=6233 RepID=A0A7E4UWP3_PANRE